MSYFIQPFVKTETTTETITSIQISVCDIVLGVSAKIITQYFNNGRGIYLTQDTLTGDDYTNWGNDDNYIINFVCQKYGLVLV